MVKKAKTKGNQVFENLKRSGILGPFGLAVVGFLLGGPITAAVLFLIWKTKWSSKTKTSLTVAFVLIFNLIQIIFAKQLITMTYQIYSNLWKSIQSK